MNNLITSLFQRLYISDKRLKGVSHQEAILMMGTTGAGKSATSLLISGAPLRTVLKPGGYMIQNAVENPEVIIGHVNKSETQVPNILVFKANGKIYKLFDCPGFLDTDKFHRVIANSYHIYQLFSNIPKIKFILTIDQATIKNKATGFIGSVTCFLNLFVFNELFTVDVLAKSVILLFSKASMEIQHILQVLQSLIADVEDIDINGIDPEIFTTFLQRFIDNTNQIEIICPATKTALPVTNALTKLDAIPYWSRMHTDKGADMSNINYVIAEKELGHKQIVLAKQAFESCDNAIHEYMRMLKDALNQVKNNLIHNPQSWHYLEVWEAAIKEYSARLPCEQYVFNVEPSDKYLKRLQLLGVFYKQMELLTLRHEQEHFDLVGHSIKEVQASILKILQAFVKYGDLSYTESQIVKKFAFIIHRKLEESQILSKIKKEFTRNNRDAVDLLNSEMIQKFKDLEIHTINYLEIQLNKSKDYYDELLELLKKYPEHPGVGAKISQVYQGIGEIAGCGNRHEQAIRNLWQARVQSEIYNAQSNQQAYVNVDINLNKNIADILFALSIFDLALVFYKVIDNTKKIVECYERLRVNIIIRYDVLIEMGDYYKSILQFQSARLAYKDAQDSTEDILKKKIAARKLIETTKPQYIQALVKTYEERQQRGQFFYRLPAKFDPQEMFGKVANHNNEQLTDSLYFVSTVI